MAEPNWKIELDTPRMKLGLKTEDAKDWQRLELKEQRVHTINIQIINKTNSIIIDRKALIVI